MIPRQIKIAALIAMSFSIVKLSLAEGILNATLLPYYPSVPPLSAYVLINTPDTSGSGPFFPVLFQISVNTNQPVFDAARIAGGSTAWAFDLGSPTIVDGTMFFSGTTDMGAFQIDDMLANRTQFELSAGYGSLGYLSGPLLSVPEPGSVCLFTVGFFMVSLRRRIISGSPNS